MNKHGNQKALKRILPLCLGVQAAVLQRFAVGVREALVHGFLLRLHWLGLCPALDDVSGALLVNFFGDAKCDVWDWVWLSPNFADNMFDHRHPFFGFLHCDLLISLG